MSQGTSENLMANKSEEATEAQAAAPEETPAEQQPQQQPQQPQQLQLDDSGIVACYANFCRVNGTPEELIIDFGLNAQPFGAPTESLKVNQRLVINYYTAKRLLGALSMSVQRHEAAFGVLETDVQKRVLPGAMRQAPQQK